jgi:hypothetical protein
MTAYVPLELELEVVDCILTVLELLPLSLEERCTVVVLSPSWMVWSKLPSAGTGMFLPLTVTVLVTGEKLPDDDWFC